MPFDKSNPARNKILLVPKNILHKLSETVETSCPCRFRDEEYYVIKKIDKKDVTYISE